MFLYSRGVYPVISSINANNRATFFSEVTANTQPGITYYDRLYFPEIATGLRVQPNNPLRESELD